MPHGIVIGIPRVDREESYDQQFGFVHLTAQVRLYGTPRSRRITWHRPGNHDAGRLSHQTRNKVILIWLVHKTLLIVYLATKTTKIAVRINQCMKTFINNPEVPSLLGGTGSGTVCALTDADSCCP
jgi:hypothetical protein